MRNESIYYDVLSSQMLGEILVVSSEVGLLRIEFPVAGKSPSKLFKEIQPEAKVVKGGAKLKDVTRQLKEYLGGRRRHFKVRLDLKGQTPFGRQVLLKAFRIPYGKTVTYGQLARSCGSPNGARAVGQVMAKNPIPIIIPCHRVLASGGKLGGYSGGLKYKKMLLNLEGSKI